MKKIMITTVLMLSAVFASQAQRISTPQASPTQTITQNFGVGTIQLSYSRPGLKGRSIGDGFVPYDKVWRTGANMATTLEFSNDVAIGGKDIKAGKYGLLSIPGADEWVVIITKDLNVNNPSLYNQNNDVVRLSVPVKKVSEQVETFTMNFGQFTGSSCVLSLEWEHTLIEVPITTNTDQVVMKEIEDIFKENNKPYYAAAQYYYDNDKDLKQAKEWIDIASADPRSARMNHVWLLKARIYKAIGDKKGAKSAALETIKVAKANNNDDYQRMAQEIIDSL